MARKSLGRRIAAALEAHQRSVDPLDQLDAARRLREAAEEAESLAVKAARESGATWTEIGALYGLTKQGAQQRFRSTQRASDVEAPTRTKHASKTPSARKARAR
jgi:hypothetical protein